MTFLFLIFSAALLVFLLLTLLFYKYFVSEKRLSAVKKLDKIKYLDFDFIPFGFKKRSLLALPKVIIVGLGITLIAGFGIMLIGFLAMLLVQAF